MSLACDGWVHVQLCPKAGKIPLWKSRNNMTCGQNAEWEPYESGCCWACFASYRRAVVVTLWHRDRSRIAQGTDASQASFDLTLEHERGHIKVALLIAKEAQEKLDATIGYGHSCTSEAEASVLASNNLITDRRALWRKMRNLERAAQESYDTHVDHFSINAVRQHEFTAGNWAPPQVDQMKAINMTQVCEWGE